MTSLDTSRLTNQEEEEHEEETVAIEEEDERTMKMSWRSIWQASHKALLKT